MKPFARALCSIKVGCVDVLINNAGTFVPKLVVDVTKEELDGFLNGNLRGTYLTPMEATMPYVNIKITREGGTTAAQKADLIKGVTEVLADVLNKSPATTVVVIEEVEMENWGIGGLPAAEYRARKR